MSQRSPAAPAAPEPTHAFTSSASPETSRSPRGGARSALADWLRWSSLGWNLLVPAIIALLTLLPRLALVHSLDLVTDESVYIPTGMHDLSLLRLGQMSNPYWQVNYEAPALPKITMGIGAEYGIRHLGAQGWLIGARLPGVFLFALTLIVAYFLARPIFGRFGATLGALALALSPWLAYYNSIAYLDTYLLCFMTLAALLTWHAARRPWLWPLVGALGGLAFASKYTAAFVAVPIVVYLLFHSVWYMRRRPAWQAVLMLPVGLLTAYIADPAIWVDPVTRMWTSIIFQYKHATAGHDAFWNGAVWTHVPPGIAIYILMAKVSLFITIPALLALPWALWRLASVWRARRTLTPLDDTAAFALIWLGCLIPLFASLNIIVGAHYVLPLAPPVAFIAGWAYTSVARWLAPRVSVAAQRLLAQRVALSETLARNMTRVAFAVLIAMAMLLPHTIGLLTVNQAEGYTAEWLNGENPSLQVAYPGYADAVRWVVAHSQGRTTVTLVMGDRGTLDYWMGSRQTLFPQRIRLIVGTPRHFPHSEYIIWPEHLRQRQFPLPANFDHLVVARIQGGPTTYCYILRWPNANR